MSETRAPLVAGIGELLWDLLPSGPRLGGTVANFALFCARLGNRAVLVSSVGDDDYGRAARAALQQPKLDLEQLALSEDHPTGTVGVTFSTDNQPSYRISPGVAWDFLGVTPVLLDLARGVDAVCFGTLGQRHEVSRSTIRRFLEATSPACVRVCDINIRMPDCTAEVLRWSMAHATILKVSEEELPLTFRFLTELGMDGGSVTPEAAAQCLLKNFPHCRLVATTLGAQGSLITSREGAFRHAGFPVKLVDTVGAGDAFTAGMLHAYLRGGSLRQISEIGNLCGSYVAGRPGATPPLSAELIDHIRDWLGQERHS